MNLKVFKNNEQILMMAQLAPVLLVRLEEVGTVLSVK
eukprot:SAG11_NODE_1161_length_5638_cov_10.644545_1_plen_37_part_00